VLITISIPFMLSIKMLFRLFYFHQGHLTVSFHIAKIGIGNIHEFKKTMPALPPCRWP
jgi:hypothetical protein